MFGSLIAVLNLSCDDVRIVVTYHLDILLQDSDRSSVGSPEPVAATGSLHEHQMMMDEMKNSRKNSPSPENLHQAKRAAVAQAHLNGTSEFRFPLLRRLII